MLLNYEQNYTKNIIDFILAAYSVLITVRHQWCLPPGILRRPNRRGHQAGLLVIIELPKFEGIVILKHFAENPFETLQTETFEDGYFFYNLAKLLGKQSNFRWLTFKLISEHPLTFGSLLLIYVRYMTGPHKNNFEANQGIKGDHIRWK